MERNELQDRVENEVVYRAFTANVPIAIWEEQFKIVDSFCKSNFMDNRWSMIWTLVNAEIDDYKFAMLFDRIQELEVKIAELEKKPVEEKKDKLKTFGKRD